MTQVTEARWLWVAPPVAAGGMVRDGAHLVIAHTDADGIDRTALLATLTPGDVLHLADPTAPAEFWTFTVKATPTTVGDTVEVPINSGGHGALPEPLTGVRVTVTVLDADGPGARLWPTVDDCMDRLGVDPSDAERLDALGASLAATIAMVKRARRDLATATTVADDDWQGVVILACLDYRAANSPNGFTGYDGGYGGDTAERFRAHQLLRIQRYVPPRVG